MLNIENLTKIYEKGNRKVLALNGVSFTLNSTGFVFVVGKSGCGKSTLLNLIGGLDNVTSGDIICDGNSLSSFSETDFDSYRNSYLGFVFQDYCLIDDLSVGQNIELALNIKGDQLSKQEKCELVDNALISVDLDPAIKNRHVNELSGGQKQRIAIARALIKNPKLILADEPTGNLDQRTAKTILELLKKLSKDRLVIIVSHNLDDAKTYADRIIELSDGKLVSDLVKEQNIEDNLTFKNGVLSLPRAKLLTASQLQDINDNLANNKIKKIKQNKSGFKKSGTIEYNPTKVEIEHSRMHLKSSSRLAGIFLRKRIIASIATVVVISLLVFLLGMCQFFIQFDAGQTVYTAMKNNQESDIVLYKGYYEDDTIVSDNYIYFNDSEINKFIEEGYTGNIYKIYQTPLSISSWNMEYGSAVSERNFSGIYIKEAYGTLACNEQYLLDKFGVENTLQILAGHLTDKPNGVILTDYIADSILAQSSQFTTYESLVGKTIFGRVYVNGIIQTNYLTKYADLFDYLRDVSIGINRDNDKDYFKNQIVNFRYDIIKYYGMCYSVNSNFEEDIKDSTMFTDAMCYYPQFDAPDLQKYFTTKGIVFVKSSMSDLGANDIAVEYDIFNALFGAHFGYYSEENYQSFEPIVVNLSCLDGTDSGQKRYSMQVTIKKLLPTSYSAYTNKDNRIMYIGADAFKQVFENSKGAFGVLLEDESQLPVVYNTIDRNPYVIQSVIYNTSNAIGGIVNIFEDLFGIILFAVAVVCFVMLISYAYGNIKKRYYEIGVLKSLGATTNNVGFIFGLQTLIAGVLILAISTTLLLTLTNPINIQLSSKLLEFVGNSNLGVIEVFNANATTIVINVLIIMFVTTLSCVLPLIKLNKIKPKNIISSKE